MSFQTVLGPYQFATADENTNCGCGNSDYCTPFASGDRIAFQIPASESCCEFVQGCEALTESCIDDEGLTSDLTFTQGSESISFDEDPFVANDWILKGNTLFADNTKFVICFCITGHESFTTIKAKIDTVESDLEITGNGEFCLTVDPAFGAPTLADWGIIVTGGDTVLTAVISCLTICTYRQFDADLYDSEGGVVSGLTRSETENGNQVFFLPVLIPAEIAPGCYEVRLTENCDSTTYISQCLSLAASFPSCGPKGTLLFKWRNRNNAFGYDYTNTSYYNYLRVQGRLKHPTFPDDTEIPTFSDNTNTVINARVQKLWKVALNDLPEYVHNAIATMRRHSDFQIDGVPFVVNDGAYSPAWRKSSELATSEFEAFDQSFDGVMNSC